MLKHFSTMLNGFSNTTTMPKIMFILKRCASNVSAYLNIFIKFSIYSNMLYYITFSSHSLKIDIFSPPMTHQPT